ncbi:MAG: hypothetical protein PHQ96_06500 [Candidatus Omnitrophica bacterium]|nr:hypothetical protein [Candidatus Omnitrophota bacterium]
MRFGWETKKLRILRGTKISAENKLEGIRLMNEMADAVLTKRQKLLRRELRESININVVKTKADS